VIHLVPIPLLIVTVTWLIWAEYKGRKDWVYAAKPLSTLLVILAAALAFTRPGVDLVYTAWILVGLALSLVGDVALMFPSQRAFLLGLVAFLLAHVVYTIVFTVYSGFQPADLITGVILLAIAVAVYRYLLPGLGRMKVPVAVYVLIICLMVNRALSTLFGDVFSPAAAWLVAVGAFLFWISDLMLGINRFRRPFAWNRISLAFYFGGQLLIALSAAYLR
jgi:alkylglycerol monooxygenase